MKKAFVLLLTICLVLPLALCGCNGTPDDTSSSTNTEEATSVIQLTPDEKAKEIWSDAYAGGGFDTVDKIYGSEVYQNGVKTDDYSLTNGDLRYLFAGESSTRAVVRSEGYALTFPFTDVTADFSLGALRSKYKSETSVLTVTFENQNPYGANANGWATYRDEWLIRFLDNTDYLASNKIRRTRKAEITTELLAGYEIMLYDMCISVASKMEMPYYNVAIIRPVDNYNYFWFFVMKSTEEQNEVFDGIIKSFKEIGKSGIPTSSVGAYPCEIPEYWSDETKAYYQKLQTQTTVDWGAYHNQNDDEYISFLQGAEGWDYNPEIFMVYLHIGYYDTLTYFDEALGDTVAKHAGGNGFNGKPVLDLTYQFTCSNNAVAGKTAIFDVLRGTYDEHFRTLAKQIKAYGKPVLFRLNNEMNSDWTDYSGIASLCDPDLFIQSWERLYNIFREEGVDNTIWIFNPIAVTVPYSNWGGMLNYMPDPQYVQMYGVTYYEMNNTGYVQTFKEMYTYVYNNSMPYFTDYPWIIGEFGCAAGGERYYDWDERDYVPTVKARNQGLQAQWVTGMFDCFENNQEQANEFCKRIKAAIWFSANDYADIGGLRYITNYLMLDKDLPVTLAAFREGLKRTHPAE